MSEPAGHAEATAVRRGVLRRLVQVGTTQVVQGIILFAFAGRLDWAMAWAYLAVGTAVIVHVAVSVLPKHPDLAAERARLCSATARWDKVVMALITACSVATLVVAGLDHRFVWSTAAPAVQVAGLIVIALAGALTASAMAANRVVAAAVRIQRDRGHTVVTTGPYRVVRHPGYAGIMASCLATPIVLGSWWALVPAAVTAVLYAIRTSLEDRLLRRELDGYVAYALRVRYRLVPGLW
jgi:protein-S-isoprenylcysteine O-methyltransferase Ste14